MERIKLIWDFRGPNAQQTAKHHAIHLNEFAEAEKLEHTVCDIEQLSDMHFVAYLVVEKRWMDSLRERLKPHRGQLYAQNQ